MASGTVSLDDKIKNAKGKRISFTDQRDVIDLPDLVGHQNKSFQWFVEEGLGELLAEISPIDDYTGAKLRLNFKDYHFDQPKMTELSRNAAAEAWIPMPTVWISLLT